MALLWLEGFEGFSTSNLEAHLLRKYSSNVGADIVSEAVVTGRYGGTALRGGSSAGDQFLYTPNFTAQQTVISGVAAYFPDLITSANPILQFRTGTTNHCGLWISGDRFFEFRRNTTVVSTATVRAKQSRWCFLEIKVLISNTVGSYEVRLDGTTILSGSGLDTANAVTESCNNVMLNWGNMNDLDYTWRLDDWYVCDSTGSVNNDFLGDRRVVSHIPTSNDAVQFTPSAGSNFQCVDETPATDDTDYVESSTVGHQDLYGLDDETSLTEVNGVMVQAVVRGTVGGESAKLIAKSNGVTSTSAAKVQTTSYKHEVHIVERNPDGPADWTQSTLNAATFGVEVG